MPSSSKKPNPKRSEANRRRWQNPEYRKKMVESAKKQWENKEYRKKMEETSRRMWDNPEHREKMREASKKQWEDEEWRAKISKKIRKAKIKQAAEYRKTPEYKAKQRQKKAEQRERNRTKNKRISDGIRNYFQNHPEERERRRKLALANPMFNGEKNGELHTKDKWTEEQRKNVAEHITKYNKSKAGRKMASRRSKKTLSDAATKQRWMDGKEAWYAEHPEVRVEHAKKYLQPHNDERHRRAEQRKSIKWYREEYKKGVKPIIKPLPDQPQEYYDELDEFFAEGL